MAGEDILEYLKILSNPEVYAAGKVKDYLYPPRTKPNYDISRKIWQMSGRAQANGDINKIYKDLETQNAIKQVMASMKNYIEPPGMLNFNFDDEPPPPPQRGRMNGTIFEDRRK